VINLRADFTGLDEILQRLDSSRIPAVLTSLVTGLSRILLRFGQMGAPVATGNLRRSAFMLMTDDLNGVVGFGTKYAGVVEGGSAAHTIAAVNARTLAFIPTNFSTLADATAASTASRKSGQVKKNKRAQGLAIFPMHVYHPGTVANPFFEQAWSDAQSDAAEFLAEVGSRYVSGEEAVD
jgi:hypothetical protein